MSSIFINGTKYSLLPTLAAAVAISAITNADPAVATTTTPPADGDILVLQSNWPDLNDTVVRAAGADANTFELEGIDTTNVTRFPAGGGAGSKYAKISGAVPIDQVRDVVVSGGEQQYFTYSYVEDQDSRQRQKPTFKNPVVLTFTLDYDPDKAWYDALVEADRARVPVVIRADMPNGAVLLYYGNPSFNKIPTGQSNQNLTNTATLSLLSDPVRYEAA